MKQRAFSIFLIVSLVVSMFALVKPVRAEDPFPSPDADSDGLLNEMETAGWYNLAGGPFLTDPRDADSDNDGLTDGEEKLFATQPLDSHSPGISVRYDNSVESHQVVPSTLTKVSKSRITLQWTETPSRKSKDLENEDESTRTENQSSRTGRNWRTLES